MNAYIIENTQLKHCLLTLCLTPLLCLTTLLSFSQLSCHQ